MPVTMICPNLSCGQPIVAPDSARGKVLRCAHCRQPFLVPAPAQPVAVPDDSPDKEKKPKRR